MGPNVLMAGLGLVFDMLVLNAPALAEAHFPVDLQISNGAP